MTKGIILSILLTIACLICRSQNYYIEEQHLFRGVATIGINLAQIDGDGPAGYNTVGFMGGIGTLIQWHRNFSTSLELLYSQRGSIQNGIIKNGAEEKFKINTDYVEIPVCLNINDDKILMVGVGLSPAVLTNYKMKYETRDLIGGNVNNNPTSCLAAPMREYDLSGLVKIQFRVAHSFSIGARYQYSLISLRPPCEGDTRANGQYHNVINFYLEYKR